METARSCFCVGCVGRVGRGIGGGAGAWRPQGVAFAWGAWDGWGVGLEEGQGRGDRKELLLRGVRGTGGACLQAWALRVGWRGLTYERPRRAPGPLCPVCPPSQLSPVPPVTLPPPPPFLPPCSL